MPEKAFEEVREGEFQGLDAARGRHPAHLTPGEKVEGMGAQEAK